MKYSFVNPAGSVLRTQEFPEIPDQPNPNKGRWLEDVEPTYDPRSQSISVASPIDASATSVPYVIADLPIALLSANKMEDLGIAYLTARYMDVSYMGTNFQADDESQRLLSRSLNGMNGTAPADFYWKASNNTEVPMTFAEAQGLASAMFNQGWAAFKNYQIKKALVAAAVANNSITDLEAISWTS